MPLSSRGGVTVTRSVVHALPKYIGFEPVELDVPPALQDCSSRKAIVDDNEDRALNHLVRGLMRELREELTELDVRIAGYDRKIRELYRNSEICQRLGKVEGIGPVTATALVAAVGDTPNDNLFWSCGLQPSERFVHKSELCDGYLAYAHYVLAMRPNSREASYPLLTEGG